MDTSRPVAVSPPPSSRMSQLRFGAICVAVGLLLGLVPTGFRLMQVQRERDTVQRQLQLATMEGHLSSAAVLARHGDYTASRDAASRFFADAKREADSGELPAAQQSHLQAALADRDPTITLLTRGDPAGAERLTTMFVAYRAAFPR